MSPESQEILLALSLGAVCGLLGVFVVARGMAFLADAMAHAALVGVAVGLLLQESWLGASPGQDTWPLRLFFLSFCVGLALLVQWLVERTGLRPDTVIAFCFTGSVALGVIILHRLEGPEELEKWLFGDIEKSGPRDWLSALLLTAVGFWAILRWLGPLALSVLDEEIALADGLPARKINRLLALGVGITIGMTLRMAGALLITALLVIPASTARVISGSLRTMVLVAAAAGGLGASVGAMISRRAAMPTGATIVLCQIAFLLGGLLFRELLLVAKASGWSRRFRESAR
jgi:ABC-type Mn2+/Zn2+ transport system permease subunit